jgi:hypothetical protein
MRFRYLRDPLFVFCVALYFLNRWVLKPHLTSVFLHAYLNDLICIPFWVPIMLFVMKRLRLRKSDELPTAFEILIPLILWSWVFEAYLPFTPMFKHLATSDYRDVLAYTMGAFMAASIWRFSYQKCHATKVMAFLRPVVATTHRANMHTPEKTASGPQA